MADANAKEWTPVCVASTRRESERELSDPSQLSSNSSSTVQIEPVATSGGVFIDQDTEFGYFKSAEWSDSSTVTQDQPLLNLWCIGRQTELLC